MANQVDNSRTPPLIIIRYAQLSTSFSNAALMGNLFASITVEQLPPRLDAWLAQHFTRRSSDSPSGR